MASSVSANALHGLALPTTKRRRSGKPKSRTGCLTCKKRRLKCDEAWPHCKRCSSSDRLCEGYADHPEYGYLALAIVLPTKHPDWSAKEKTICQHFQSYILNDIPGTLLDRAIWNEYLLQLMTAQTVLRYAVVAVGAVYCGSRASRAAGDSYLALAYYTKAIHLLRVQLKVSTDADLHVLLVTGLLFTTFELHNGNFKKAGMHLQGVLRILKSLQEQGDSILQKKFPADIMYRYRRTSRRLMQYLSRHDPDIECCIESSEEKTFLTQSSFRFSNLRGARIALDARGMAMRQLLADIAKGETPILDRPAYKTREFLQEQSKQLTLLSEWLENLSAISSCPSRDASQIQTERLLRIHHLCARLKVSMALSQGKEMLWDECIPDFKLICNHVEAFLRQEKRKPHPFAEFLLDSAILAPLDFTIRKCRDPTVRRLALQLLLDSDHQEGPLRTCLISMVGEKIIQLEEKNLQDPLHASDIPEDHRVESIHLDCRAAHAKYVWRQRSRNQENSWTYFEEEAFLPAKCC